MYLSMPEKKGSRLGKKNAVKKKTDKMSKITSTYNN